MNLVRKIVVSAAAAGLFFAVLFTLAPPSMAVGLAKGIACAVAAMGALAVITETWKEEE